MAEIVHSIKEEFEVPGGLNIYRLRRPDVSEAAVRRVSGRFGLRATSEAGTFVINARGSAYSEPSGWGLKMFRASGGWRYRHAVRWQADDGRGHLTIDEEEAARLALDALARYALPTEPELERVRVERLRVAHAERGGGHHEERVVGARALFGRVLDGLPVDGPGGKTVVYLDHARELTGIDHLWRAIESVHEPVSTLRPIEEAVQEVRRRYGSGEGRVEVTALRLGYFELGWDDDQEYLQPAYVFTLRLASEDSRFRMNATVPVAAAVNAVGPIQPQVPSREPQARRAG
jgi:hypothetical protein